MVNLGMDLIHLKKDKNLVRPGAKNVNIVKDLITTRGSVIPKQEHPPLKLLAVTMMTLSQVKWEP